MTELQPLTDDQLFEFCQQNKSLQIERDASGDWSAGKMTFTPDSDHAVLVLTYRRPEGQVRTEGYVDIRRVTSSEE